MYRHRSTAAVDMYPGGAIQYGKIGNVLCENDVGGGRCVLYNNVFVHLENFCKGKKSSGKDKCYLKSDYSPM